MDTLPLYANGKVLTDNTIKAEALSNHFPQIFTEEDSSSMPNIGCSDIPAMESIIFNREGIINLLKNLDSKKANGPDKLPTTPLKIRSVDTVCRVHKKQWLLGPFPSGRSYRSYNKVPYSETVDLSFAVRLFF